jgi:hypothetical protein
LPDLRKLVKQPRQRHFQLNMIVGDFNPSGSHLAKGADAKRHPVCRPLHREHGKLEEALTQRRFDPTQSLLIRLEILDRLLGLLAVLAGVLGDLAGNFFGVFGNVLDLVGGDVSCPSNSREDIRLSARSLACDGYMTTPQLTVGSNRPARDDGVSLRGRHLRQITVPRTGCA